MFILMGHSVTRILRFLALVIVLALISAYLFSNDSKIGRAFQESFKNNRMDLDRDCQCRKIPAARFGKRINFCSEYSTLRGDNQKILSFSFYGGFKTQYFEGIKYNIDGTKNYYPGYVMRLYHDMKAPLFHTDGGKQICDLYCKEDVLDLCNVHHIDLYPTLPSYFGMLWRFAPMADPLVSEWHSRDLDSRISAREISAVKDWKSTNKTYHIMRDHPLHGSYFVGCCFGMKISSDNILEMRNDFDNMLLKSEKVWNKGLDQDLLNIFVWPRAKDNMVAHDSYLCNMPDYSFADNKPWPTKRLEGRGLWNFVGGNGGTITLETHGECPKECRPKDHQDWILC